MVCKVNPDLLTNDNTSRAEVLLMRLEQGREVSRWDITLHTSEIKSLLEEEKYKHLTDQVHDLFDSSKESL